MRRNGFIFICLAGAVATLAGTPGYLPKVGPVALQFQRAAADSPRAELPPLETPAELPPAPLPPAPGLPPAVPPETGLEIPAPPGASLMQDPPVVVLEAASQMPTNSIEPLIGTPTGTNEMITPQMFLRFFGPTRADVSYEVVAPAPSFTPARPATLPSSSVTYTQPKS